ncbi:Uncharacterised protein [Vibrio cholerae]|uniref:Uncharacterized protein n=1 Tax=Vibrio cholerae TaxID=666 RepID=A0A655Z1T1_VIBCL|nr:Uncharacterised protein [Vibrio cholerae]
MVQGGDALLVQQLAQLCALFIRTSDQYCHNTLNQCEISNQSMRADIGLPLFVVTIIHGHSRDAPRSLWLLG